MKKSRVHIAHRQLGIGVFTQHGADVFEACFLGPIADKIDHGLVDVHRVQRPVRADRASHWNGKRPAAGTDVGHDISRLELQFFYYLVDLQPGDPPGPVHPLQVIFCRPLLQLESRSVRQTNSE